MSRALFAYVGFFKPRDGYGYGTLQIARELHKLAGNQVELADLRVRTEFDVPVVVVSTPDWLPNVRAPKIIAHTMYEATRMPDGWVGLLNTHAAEVLVPCTWNRQVFKANGVTRPLRILHWGVSPHDYWPLDRSDHAGKPYTFLWSGTPDRRKGWDVAYKAFWQAFRGYEGAQLVMHFRKRPEGLNVGDANVRIVEGFFGRAELRAMLQAADCFVFPSRGEGWGLPPREAAATGMPVLATNAGGLAEQIERWARPVKVVGMSKAEYGFWECALGEWFEPDADDLAEQMRWCYENREEAAVLGQKAARWLGWNQMWEDTAYELFGYMVARHAEL